MTITVSTADPRSIKALALLEGADRWQRGHTKDGRSFFAIPGSEPGLLHMVSTRECSCADFRNRGQDCKHILAVRLWVTRNEAAQPVRRSRYATPISPAQADRVAAEAIRLEAELERRAANAATYREIWGSDECAPLPFPPQSGRLPPGSLRVA
jgi:hypothetical protein